MQDIEHLPDLELAFTTQSQDGIFLIDAGISAFEIKAVPNLAVGLIDGIGHFVKVHF